jgi:Colicin V production protein
METEFHFKVIDVLFLILCLRVIYSAITAKLLREFFKVIGLILGMLFAFHFYFFLGQKSANIPFINVEYLNFISFIFIFFSIRSTIGLIGMIVSFLGKKKEVASKEKWVLLASGGLRTVLLTSIILFSLNMSPLDSKYFVNSFSYKICRNFAPETYLFLAKMVSKSKTGFKPNEDVQKQHGST